MITFIALLTIMGFGTATSAHAFVGLTTITIICVSTFAAIVATDQAISEPDGNAAGEPVAEEDRESKQISELANSSPGG